MWCFSLSPFSLSDEKYRALCIKRVYSTTPPLNNNMITRLILLQKEAFEVPSKMRTRHQTLIWTSCINNTNRILIFSGRKQWLWKLLYVLFKIWHFQIQIVLMDTSSIQHIWILGHHVLTEASLIHNSICVCISGNKKMEKMLDAHNSNRAAAFGTQVYQLLTLECRVNSIITYTEKQQKAPGANITGMSFTYEILC